MSDGDYGVRLLRPTGETAEGVFAIAESGDDFELTLRSAVGEFRAVEWSLFHALCAIRRQLEPLGWRPVCYGSCMNVFPSQMSLQMGGGQKAYRVTVGRHAQLEEMVDIFESGPEVVPVTVEEQDRFREEWIRSPKS